MAIKWIVVAENSGARLFKTLGRSPDLHLIKEFIHPEGREKNQLFDRDRPGRSFDSVGGGRHAMSAEVDPHRHNQQVFSHELINHLSDGFDTHQFSELILVAAPQLLGELRQAMPERLHQTIVEEVTKNFPMWMKTQEIIGHLRKDLFSLQAVVPNTPASIR